jgi:quinolinate synthase
MKYGSVALPDIYRVAGESELTERIQSARRKLAKKLLILTHHYQRVEIVRMGDSVGDSYGLAKTAARSPDADHIVFCGVHFMAESADILCNSDQKVYLPNPGAGCPMADMAPAEQVYDAWDALEKIIGPGRMAPISYINSSAELKAFTGKNGGLICTSSNAAAALEWAFEKFDKIFFFPDQHLGRNTANRYRIPKDQIVLYDPEMVAEQHARRQLEKAKVILWPGYCYVHSKFKPEHIDYWRQIDPSAKIVVHPECNENVVGKADAVGSTSFIVDYVEKAPPGSVIAIGTELNLVHRLAITNTDKEIFELSGDSCPMCANMFRTSLADLCYTLENLEKANRIVVPEDIRADAKTALERMLEVGK